MNTRDEKNERRSKQALLERLREQEFEIYSLKEMIDRLQEGIYITDSRGNTLHVNSAFLHLSGLDERQLIGRRVHDLRDEGVLPNSCCAKVIETRAPVSMINNYYKGQKCLVSGSPVFDPEGRLIRTVAIVRDVSELDKMMETLSRGDGDGALGTDSGSGILKLPSLNDFDMISSVEPVMKDIMSRAARLAQLESTVLITGETGTGKNHLATAIHQMGAAKRGGQPVRINCGAIPEHLIESELFGYEAGAFTGARPGGRKGLLETAGTGSVFFDEIGDMPYVLQVKLLNALNDRQFYRVGGNRMIDFKARVIATTNADMEDLVSQKKFRADLFYRLNVFRIDIPPLRDRPADILPLVEFFREQYNRVYNSRHSFSPEAAELLRAYAWPGNIRELKSFIEKSVAFSGGGQMNAGEVKQLLTCFPQARPEGASAAADSSGRPVRLKDAMDAYEKQILAGAIGSAGTLRQAADALGVDLSTLMRKKKRLGVERGRA